MSCVVMSQSPLAGDCLLQRYYQFNDRAANGDRDLAADNSGHGGGQRPLPLENVAEKYKPHISCLTSSKMFHDEKHSSNPTKHRNTEASISHYGEKDDKNLLNYVLVKNYAGDVETVVDEHFSRALDASRKNTSHSAKDRLSTAKHFPPSYYQPFRETRTSYNPGGSNRYHPYCNIPTSDHWAAMSAQECKSFAHRGVHSETYSQLGAAFPYQYAFQTLQQPISKMTANEFNSQTIKPEGWVSRHYESGSNPYYQETSYEPTYISPVHHGIETSISQEYPKDF